MSGHVFHPDHEALHGITVVLDTADGRTIVGRYHDAEGGVVKLHDVAIYVAGAVSREDYLRRTLKFGVRTEHKFLAVPTAAVRGITPLGELAP